MSREDNLRLFNEDYWDVVRDRVTQRHRPLCQRCRHEALHRGFKPTHCADCPDGVCATHEAAPTASLPVQSLVSRRTFQVSSSRKGQPPYTVMIDAATGDFSCTCDGFTKWRRGQRCSHINTAGEQFLRELESIR